jgi:hypothetical protein
MSDRSNAKLLSNCTFESGRADKRRVLVPVLGRRAAQRER